MDDKQELPPTRLERLQADLWAHRSRVLQQMSVISVCQHALPRECSISEPDVRTSLEGVYSVLNDTCERFELTIGEFQDVATIVARANAIVNEMERPTLLEPVMSTRSPASKPVSAEKLEAEGEYVPHPLEAASLELGHARAVVDLFYTMAANQGRDDTRAFADLCEGTMTSALSNLMESIDRAKEMVDNCPRQGASHA